MSPEPPAGWAVRAYRIVLAAWLLGWYWKAWFYGPYLFSEALAIPLEHHAFPGWLEQPWVAAVAYVLPAATVPSLLRPGRGLMLASTSMLLAASALGCVHLELAPDATFVVSFWVAAWLTWLAAHARRDDGEIRLRACVLAQCLVGVVFLGGLVGKLTADYFDGEAIYQLYFVEKDNFPYPHLRRWLAPTALRAAATWMSRATIVIELTMALAPLYPIRPFAIAGAALMIAMVLASTVQLLSVFASLIGLLAATRMLAGWRPH